MVSYWRNYVHEVLVNRLGGLSLPRKSVVRLTDRPDMTLDVKMDVKQQCNSNNNRPSICPSACMLPMRKYVYPTICSSGRPFICIHVCLFQRVNVSVVGEGKTICLS